MAPPDEDPPTPAVIQFGPRRTRPTPPRALFPKKNEPSTTKLPPPLCTAPPLPSFPKSYAPPPPYPPSAWLWRKLQCTKAVAPLLLQRAPPNEETLTLACPTWLL